MQREDLRNLLTDSRARIDPADYGLTRPSDPRGRHAKGLTQFQMDWLIKCRPGTYGRFECGRLKSPSNAFLQRVAEILKFTAHEWLSLWVYATGSRPPYPLDPTAGDDVPAVWKQIVHELDSMAYVNGAGWELLAHNEAFTAMFPSGAPPRNTLRWMLLDDEARDEVLIDWERRWAPLVISQLRAAHAANPDHPTLAQLVTEVRQDPRAGPVYRGDPMAYAHPDGDARPLHHARLGPGTVRIGAAEPLRSPGARLMIIQFTPDAPTAGPAAGSRPRGRSA
ncbi:XRE family transcriptional regulator [Streptomyces armeniacus]|uniref:XRE family transcriptional regulator n=1 Tax=Streptomyces armeniacus TaxID=83291 RepID=A0A345XTA3_9ACTN|nr:XRE family transcriptional regulator [Streptomyces armeniacus]AXK34869.1 XRE family transcriptional regulator [Streptomyces armeniacus]